MERSGGGGVARLEAGESGHDTPSRFYPSFGKERFVGETVFLMMSIFPRW